VSSLGANTLSERRTGETAWIKHAESQVVRDVVGRVSDLVGIPAVNAENLQVIHYGLQQEYQAHFDAWDINTPKGQEKTARGGNRALTALMYLNEVDGGGGTGFPKLELEVQAIPGRLVIFHNLYEGQSMRHRNSLHGGLPVTEGEKWACNLWFRERPYQEGAAVAAAPRRTPTQAHNRAARRKAERASRKRNR
jgi:prolyl 4-hydroxylase